MIMAIYIGDKFYRESGTSMSSIYLEDGLRYDYGFMKRDLAKGETVQIRPATAQELLHYQRKLDELTQLRKQRDEADND